MEDVVASGVRPEFWQGRRVLVTGHTGFKGGWLALWLHSIGARVLGFALPPAGAPRFFDAVRLEEAVQHRTGDVRDLESVLRVVQRFRPEIVIHLAARSTVSDGYEEPVATYATNVMGTVNVLEAVRRTGGVEATLVVTSDKCSEGQPPGAPRREDDPLAADDPYGSSKACAELVVRAFGRSFFSSDPAAGEVATLRAGNAIGGGDWGRARLVPDLARALSSGVPPVLRCPGAVRPWQHVLDALAGYLRAAEFLVEHRPRAVRCWNIGPDPDAEVTVGDLAEGFCRRWGSGAHLPIVGAVGAEGAAETVNLRLDSSRARRELGWRPRWTLAEALDRTAEWYRRFYDGEDMQAFTRAQIAAHSPHAVAPERLRAIAGAATR